MLRRYKFEHVGIAPLELDLEQPPAEMLIRLLRQIIARPDDLKISMNPIPDNDKPAGPTAGGRL